MAVGRFACLVTGLTVVALAASACGTTSGGSVVRELGAVKERMDEVDRDLAALRPEEPTTQASVKTWARAVKKGLRRYEPIREDALALREEAEDVNDSDVQRAAELLVRMIDHRRKAMTHFVRAVEQVTFRMQLELLGLLALEDDTRKEMNEAWAEIADRLAERYAAT